MHTKEGREGRLLQEGPHEGLRSQYATRRVDRLQDGVGVGSVRAEVVQSADDGIPPQLPQHCPAGEASV